MNAILTFSGTSISEYRFVIGCMDIQTDNDYAHIDFRVDILGEMPNVCICDPLEEFDSYQDDLNILISTYADMYWIKTFFSDESEKFENTYQTEIKKFLAKLITA